MDSPENLKNENFLIQMKVFATHEFANRETTK